jgi:DNA-binding SARP family transcriptional activator
MLREERVAAVLLLADLAAALRQHGRSLPHLRALATEQPLHEPLYARLIAALAATGLQAQAVAAYQGIRRRLAEDLGIDPGPELTETYCRVLRQQIGPAARGS